MALIKKLLFFNITNKIQNIYNLLFYDRRDYRRKPRSGGERSSPTLIYLSQYTRTGLP
jgi:hypothetical protein